MTTPNPLSTDFPMKPAANTKRMRSTDSVFALLENVNTDIQANKKVLAKMVLVGAVLSVMTFFLCVAGAYYVKDTTTSHNVMLDRHSGEPVSTMGVQSAVDIDDLAASDIAALSTITYETGAGITRERMVKGVDRFAECELAEGTDKQCVAIFTDEDVIIKAPGLTQVLPVAEYDPTVFNPMSEGLTKDMGKYAEEEGMLADDDDQDAGNRRRLQGDSTPHVNKMVALWNFEGRMEAGSGCGDPAITDVSKVRLDFGKGPEEITPGLGCIFHKAKGAGGQCYWKPDDESETCFQKHYFGPKDTMSADDWAFKGNFQLLAVSMCLEKTSGTCGTKMDHAPAPKPTGCSRGDADATTCGFTSCESPFGCRCNWFASNGVSERACDSYSSSTAARCRAAKRPFNTRTFSCKEDLSTPPKPYKATNTYSTTHYGGGSGSGSGY